ncbi:GNAT family N-acetyltransferase [Kaistella sp. DKR-2]|uniref:GNAT family N-acetyltransferase n=1 Tax=Kaistella soli TaxID=2849654 RepID=UPI001C26D2FA|nr:GNAT family N-acetyltransferase [Kaistella soli]MBU8882939.1 GNAT family N-acetyltransferase [Kaistella soli]
MTSFKKAAEADIQLIRELAEQSWNSAYAELLSQEQIDYMLSEMYSAEEISSHLQNPNYHYYLIFNENTAVGFIGFEHHYEPETTKLHRIYLIDGAKGKGCGKAALNFLKKQVSLNADHRIILNVNKENKARGVYESQGFTIYKEDVFDIGNGFVMDDYLMEFKL